MSPVSKHCRIHLLSKNKRWFLQNFQLLREVAITLFRYFLYGNLVLIHCVSWLSIQLIKFHPFLVLKCFYILNILSRINQRQSLSLLHLFLLCNLSQIHTFFVEYFSFPSFLLFVFYVDILKYLVSTLSLGTMSLLKQF